MNEYIISFPAGSKVLEIGGGFRPLPFPHINIDYQKHEKVDVVHNLEEFPYPFEDEEFDGIVGLYVVEHLSWRVIPEFLKEIYRILKHGGKAIFLVPNTYEQCKKAVNEKINWKTVETLFGSQEFNPRWLGSHKMGFSPEFAKEIFEKAGFEVNVIAPMPDMYYESIPLYPACQTDMIIEAKKPSIMDEKTAKMPNIMDKINELKVKVLTGEKLANMAKNEGLEIIGGIDRRQWILSQLRKGEKIIDIGSADGWIFKNTPFFDNIVYLDIDLYELPNFIRMNAEFLYDNKYLIPDKIFDVAVIAELLEHVDNPVKVLKGARRIAKRVIITVPDPANWDEKYYPYETLEEAVKRRRMSPEELAKISNPHAKEFYKRDNYKHLFHQRWYDEKLLREHLTEAGFMNYKIYNLRYSGWAFFCVVAQYK